MDELISVIIPIYGVEDFLERCIESVITQTYENLDIILIDDGSKDNCPRICDKYAKHDSRIRVFHEKNGGVSKARNLGLEKAMGDYIAFIDGDDFISKTYIACLFGMLKKERADISVCAWSAIPEKKTGIIDVQTVMDESRTVVLSKTEALRALYNQVLFDASPWGKIFKKSYFHNVKFPEGVLYEDFAVMHRIFEQADRISYNPFKGYGYVFRSTGATLNTFSRKKMQLIDIADANESYMLTHYPELRKVILSRIARANLHIYTQIPWKHEYRKERKRIEANLRRIRKEIIFDKDARTGTRGSLLMTYAGFWTLRFLRKAKNLGKK